jgi:hypothetical protein
MLGKLAAVVVIPTDIEPNDTRIDDSRHRLNSTVRQSIKDRKSAYLLIPHTSPTYSIASCQHVGWDRQNYLLRGLEIDDKLKLRWRRIGSSHIDFASILRQRHCSLSRTTGFTTFLFPSLFALRCRVVFSLLTGHSWPMCQNRPRVEI